MYHVANYDSCKGTCQDTCRLININVSTDTFGFTPAGIVQANGRILQKFRSGGYPRGGFPL